MTEAEWLACKNPARMLNAIQHGTASDRKTRLLLCACCRSVWHQLTDERSRTAVEVAERYADGSATADERLAATVEAVRACQSTEGSRDVWLKRLAWAAGKSKVCRQAGFALESRRFERDDRDFCALVQEIFGNPFHPVPLDPTWLRWRDGAALHIAQAIYDERRFQDLPILADALEEAGCTDADLLDHCRGPGEHVRGCWVLDSLLGKG